LIQSRQVDAARGYVLGFIGVAIFSLTLPFTRVAVKELDPIFVSVGRTVAAGLCAIAILLATRQPWPSARLAWRLLVVAGGVVLGFPILSSLAMRTAPASHGSVVLALLPLGTALMSTVFAGERPTRQFWLWSVLGSACVVVYALWDGGAALQGADVLLVLAVLAASTGYAAGGALARELGGWQVICWALVGALPVTIPITVLAWHSVAGPVSLTSWACFGYLSLMSQLVGFFAWNKGLAIGGVAKVGQVQLLQTFMTQLASAALLGEALSSRSLLFAGMVALCVWFGRKAQVKLA
jgi:drug/metabolite transporter (DMT)-like permease